MLQAALLETAAGETGVLDHVHDGSETTSKQQHTYTKCVHDVLLLNPSIAKNMKKDWEKIFLLFQLVMESKFLAILLCNHHHCSA